MESQKKYLPPKTLVFNPQKIFEDNHFLVLPFFGFNQDDGYIFGLTGNVIRQGFNKPDFSPKVFFSGRIDYHGKLLRKY